PSCAVLEGGVVSASRVAVPAVPVAVKVTGLPLIPDPSALAVSVSGPAVELSVQEIAAAMPSDPVVTGVVGVTVPLPAAVANVTARPGTGLPLASLTITAGGAWTCIPSGAACRTELFAAIAVAAPAPTAAT